MLVTCEESVHRGRYPDRDGDLITRRRPGSPYGCCWPALFTSFLPHTRTARYEEILARRLRLRCLQEVPDVHGVLRHGRVPRDAADRAARIAPRRARGLRARVLLLLVPRANRSLRGLPRERVHGVQRRRHRDVSELPRRVLNAFASRTAQHVTGIGVPRDTYKKYIIPGAPISECDKSLTF